jgi:hypothetical protein
MPSSNRVMLAALVSGLLGYGLILLAGDVPDWLPLHADVLRALPGLVFGVLVLQLETRGVWRRVAVVIGCTLIWMAAFRVAVWLETDTGGWNESMLFSCGVAGGLGAWLVALLVRLIKPRRLSLLAMLMAFVSGTLGGCLIGQGLLSPDPTLLEHLLVALGFVLWQAGVGGSMLLVDELGTDEAHA